MGTETTTTEFTTEFNSPLTEREMEWARIIVHRRLDEKKTEEVRAIFDRMDMSHEALRARLAEVEKERDDWKAAAATAAETRDSWASECHKAEAQLAAERDARTISDVEAAELIHDRAGERDVALSTSRQMREALVAICNKQALHNGREDEMGEIARTALAATKGGEVGR